MTIVYLLGLFFFFLFLIFCAWVVLRLTFGLAKQTLRQRIRTAIAPLQLQRSPQNPLLRPGGMPWHAEAVFNPAAIKLDGRTYLLYRAIGADGVSRLGLATSDDGVNFKNLPFPIYNPPRPLQSSGTKRYSPVLYPSGGSWGGYEDPRIVEIEGRLYVTMNVFDGWDYIRVAVVSISRADFLKKNFSAWSPPTLLSKSGQRHKNWVLFPEKIHGKFALLHSISPNIEIAYLDTLEGVPNKDGYVESWEGPRSSIAVREAYWDNYVRSAGPPPVKTEKGWLLFYHANDKRDPSKYKLGAMLLDLDDPTRIRYRSIVPVLEPLLDYENEGKPGIVYACGTTIEGDTLTVYYGGADKVICAASAPLSSFLAALTQKEHAIL